MRFESAAQEAFAKRFTAVVHRHRKNASVFYNASNTSASKVMSAFARDSSTRPMPR